MTIPADWATSGGIKVERAKEHIRHLESEIESFEKRRPCEVVSEKDEKAGALIYRIRIIERPPLRWGAVAGDAIHNLRSALAVLWRSVMLPPGGSDKRQTDFRIYESPEEFERCNSRVVRGSRKAAVDIYRATKPYKGGNDILCRLHRLDIADKHHVLLPVVVAAQHDYTRSRIEYLGKAPPLLARLAVTDAPRFVHAPEDGAELRRISIKGVAKMDVETQFTFFVSLAEPEIVEPEPIIATLDQCLHTVDGIAKSFIDAGLIG